MSDELLLLSLARADARLRAAPALPRHFAGAHVGCAGIQDCPELHLHLLRALEHESSPALHLLRLIDARAALAPPPGAPAPPPHTGLDAAAAAALDVLARLLALRADPFVPPGDRALEAAARHLTGALVACLARPPPPAGLPVGPRRGAGGAGGGGGPAAALARGASRLLSLLCHAGGQGAPSLRQAWADASGPAAEAQKRQLLDLATSHSEPAELRVAVRRRPPPRLPPRPKRSFPSELQWICFSIHWICFSIR
jgi:hypothetical protein